MNEVSDALRSITDAIEDVIDDIEDIVKDITETLLHYFAEFFKWLGETLEDIFVKYLLEIVDSIGTFIQRNHDLFTYIVATIDVALIIYGLSIVVMAIDFEAIILQITAAWKKLKVIIESSIVGKILGVLKSVITYLNYIYGLALIYEAVKQQKYLKALYLTVKQFDKKLADEIDTLRKEVEHAIKDVMNAINEVANTFTDALGKLSSATAVLSNIIQDIGKAFGAKDIMKIGEAIQQFNKNVLIEARDEVSKVRNEVTGWITKQLDPVIYALRSMRITDERLNKYKKILQSQFARYMGTDFYKYDPMRIIIIPKVI